MKSKLSVLLIFLFSLTSAMAQKTVTGKVTKENGEPLGGATVAVKGFTTAVNTRTDGTFSLQVPGNYSTLVVTYIGNATQELSLGTRTNISVSMREEASTLTDVVVIGYQTVRRKDVLASVSSVGAKELKDIPINNAAEALNGRLAGVTATTAEGSPDAEVKVRVRGGMSITGDNSPLYIVDGVQVENGLSSISPQDIQSIDVLKDAAATAIYGARGANGVIVITTKSGRPGKLRVSYNALYGVKRLASRLDVMDPYEFVTYAWERSRQNGTGDSLNYGTTWDTLANYKNVANVDWQEEVMNRPGHLMTHNLTFGGGNSKGTYNMSYTFNDDKAIVISSRYKRHLFNLKGDYNITKKLKVTLGGRYTTTDVDGAGVSDESTGSSFSRLRNAVKYRPFLSAGQDVEEDDPLNPTGVGNGLSLTNPILLARAEYRNKKTDAYNLTASATYKITKRLTFKSTFGYDYNKRNDISYFDSISPISVSQGGSKPMIILDTTTRTTITNSNVFTYDLKDLGGSHDLSFLLGEETYQLEGFNHGRALRGFPGGTSKETAFGNQGLGITIGTPANNKVKYTNLSFFGRLSYGYKDKYLLSFNMRADGASKFAPGRQWGYFPAGSVAWRIKNEKFLENVDFISDMKFRVGIGSVGNNRIDDYLFLTKFSSTALFYGLNGQTVPAFTSTSLVNERLKWESTISRNFGFDISLLNNRLDLSVDYYKNSSRDLLLDVPIAATFGYATQLQNVGETSNKGIEVQLNATILRKKNNFNWTANFNISSNNSNVEKLGYQQFFFPPRSWGITAQPPNYIVKVGEPVGSMYGWVTDGFYTVNDFNYDPVTTVYTLKPGAVDMFAIAGGSVPGGIKYKDLSGPNGRPDSVIDDFDRTIIGNATPKFTGGLNQQFTYKNWDMSVFLNFSIGNDIFNANKIEFTNSYSANANLLDIMNDRWRTIDANGNVLQRPVTLPGVGNRPTIFARGAPPAVLAELNKNATIWQPIYAANNAFSPHSWAVEDGSFLRLNNITLGYSLPVKSLVKVKMTKLRLYVTANNLAVISNYSGYDPEVSVRRSGLTPGLDYSAYPKSRSFIFGLNASF